MFVTNTDMSITCDVAQIRAPVMRTLKTPMISGSEAATSDPKTTSRISSTIGKPVVSARSRSSLERSCIPAHSAP